MTILHERSLLWQGEDGPAEWQAAWERTRALLAPLWPDEHFRYEYDPACGVHADGAAGLATALYLLARETGTAVADVRRDQVEELIRTRAGETVPQVPLRWEIRLRALGHDLDDPADPVAARWQILRTDNSPPEEAPDGVHMDATHRWGPGVVEGLSYVLSPSLNLQF